MLSGGNVIKIGRFIGDLVLWPGVGVVPRVVGLDPGEAVLGFIGGISGHQEGLHLLHEESNGFTLSSFILGDEGCTSRSTGASSGLKSNRLNEISRVDFMLRESSS